MSYDESSLADNMPGHPHPPPSIPFLKVLLLTWQILSRRKIFEAKRVLKPSEIGHVNQALYMSLQKLCNGWWFGFDGHILHCFVAFLKERPTSPKEDCRQTVGSQFWLFRRPKKAWARHGSNGRPPAFQCSKFRRKVSLWDQTWPKKPMPRGVGTADRV